MREIMRDSILIVERQIDLDLQRMVSTQTKRLKQLERGGN